jgi:Phytanoyl-CoA dioxygenase (PhyH)
VTLTAAEREEFLSNGVIVRRGMIGSDLTGPARTLIGGWYDGQFDPGRVTEFTQRTFAPELGSHPALLAMLTSSGIWKLARTMLGSIAAVTTAQIQIRVPEADLAVAQPVKAMHVDGVACPHLHPAELRTFSLLVGIPLSDVTDPQGGTLRYLPGGHMRMARWFDSRWSLGMTDQVPPAMDDQTGIPFLCGVGDVLFMHHLVPHAVGLNHSTTPRVMTYFRLSHPDHASRRLAALRDPWLDYPPLAPGRLA